MRSTKKSVVVAGLAIAGLALGACGGGTGAGTAPGGTAGGTAEEAKTIKLVAAEYSKDHTKAFWDAFAKTYHEKTGYTLEVQVVSWDNIDQQSSTMIQNNQAPDILNLNAYASYAKDGLLYNSDEVLPAVVKDDILDTFVKYGTYQGKFYGFPDLSSARALFYNKALFKQAGIANPPKTWDELEADAKKIAATGNVGYALPLGPEESQGEFSMWLFNNGGDWKTDGKWVITGAMDNFAHLWQTDTGKYVTSLPHKQPVAAVAFSPRGDIALTGDTLGLVQLWKVPSGVAACRGRRRSAAGADWRR